MQNEIKLQPKKRRANLKRWVYLITAILNFSAVEDNLMFWGS